MNKLSIHQYLPQASRLVYGCMGLGGGWTSSPLTKADVVQANQVIDAVLEANINVFDHADIYQFGKAEQVFGQVLTQRPELREKMIIQSKCGIRFEDSNGPKRYDLSGKWITESTEQILKRLNTDYIDVLILHRPDPLMEPEEVAEVLYALKQSGKVKYFGLSNMHAAQAEYLSLAVEQPFIVNQLELSLTNLGWLEEGIYAGNPDGANVNFTAGTLEYARKNNMQIQSWGSLSQGLFTGKNTSEYPSHIQQTALKISELAEKYSTSLEAIVLSWLLRHPVTMQPVIGSVNQERIKACSHATTVSITREEWYQIYVLARGMELP